MTVERVCRCPDRGPTQIIVVNDTVISPQSGDMIQPMPTMNELYEIIYSDCIENCPSSGAAECLVEYAPTREDGAYITYFSRDRSFLAVDEEIEYIITNVTFCEKAKVTNATDDDVYDDDDGAYDDDDDDDAVSSAPSPSWQVPGIEPYVPYDDDDDAESSAPSPSWQVSGKEPYVPYDDDDDAVSSAPSPSWQVPGIEPYVP
jgi:hypothetical protein